MAGTATAVGDDGAGAFHHGFPVRVGHVGHQHITGLDLVHVFDVPHNADRAGTNFLTNGAAFGEHRTGALELVAHLGLALGLAFYCFWPGLQNVEQTVGAVLTPLNVHGAAVMVFNDQGVTRQLLYVLICQGVTVAQLGRHVRGLHQFAAGFFLLRRSELHLQQLGAQIATDHRALARLEHRLVYIKLVGVHRALHHGFTQAVAGSDENHVFKAAFGVNREHHTRSALVTAHHALHAGGQGHI